MKSKLDSTVWYRGANIRGSLRELLEASKPFASLTTLRISDLISKTLPLDIDTNDKCLERIQKADVTCPITVILQNNELHCIADGHHRIHAAIKKGMLHIPAVLIPFEKLTFPFSEIFKENRIEEWKQAMARPSEINSTN